MLATETAAEAVRGIQREATLALERAFDRASDLARRQGLKQTTGETGALRGPHDLVARMREKVKTGVLQGVEVRDRGSGGGGVFRGRSIGRSFSRRFGARADGGSLGSGRLPRVPRGLLHLRQPLVDEFLAPLGFGQPGSR